MPLPADPILLCRSLSHAVTRWIEFILEDQGLHDSPNLSDQVWVNATETCHCGTISASTPKILEISMQGFLKGSEAFRRVVGLRWKEFTKSDGRDPFGHNRFLDQQEFGDSCRTFYP